MIYTLNARDFLLYPAMKSYFALNAEDIYQALQNGFELLQKQLAAKGISYDALKGALIPNQDKKKFETCFVIDTMQMDVSDYGYAVFEKLIPLLDHNSTYSILCGDYIDYLAPYCNDSQQLLHSALNDVLIRCHPSDYGHSHQYYLIYCNRLTGNQRLKIVEGLYPHPWFTGFADVTYNSQFKTYISTILFPLCIKNKTKIIMPYPSNCREDETLDPQQFLFVSNGFSVCSINEDSYGAFLSYKIESTVPDEQDVAFSFNALLPKFDSLEKMNLNITEERWAQYLTNTETGKGKIIETLGYHAEEKARFQKEVFKQICANYIYNLNQNSHGAWLFDVCVELPTKNGHRRKTMVALKYAPDTGTVDVVTIT